MASTRKTKKKSTLVLPDGAILVDENIGEVFKSWNIEYLPSPEVALKKNEYALTPRSIYIGIDLNLSKKTGDKLKAQAVYAATTIKANTIIGVYTGLNLKSHEAKRAELKAEPNFEYLFNHGRIKINAQFAGNITSKVNHSFDPNVDFFIRNKMIVYKSNRIIEPGDQITICYGYGYDHSFAYSLSSRRPDDTHLTPAEEVKKGMFGSKASDSIIKHIFEMLNLSSNFNGEDKCENRYDKRNTILHIPSEWGNHPNLCLFISHNGVVIKTNINFQMFICFNLQLTNQKVLDELLGESSVNLRFNDTTFNGFTLLHFLLLGHTPDDIITKYFDKLVQAGASYCIKDFEYRTILWYCLNKRNISLFQSLFKNATKDGYLIYCNKNNNLLTKAIEYENARIVTHDKSIRLEIKSLENIDSDSKNVVETKKVKSKTGKVLVKKGTEVKPEAKPSIVEAQPQEAPSQAQPPSTALQATKDAKRSKRKEISDPQTSTDFKKLKSYPVIKPHPRHTGLHEPISAASLSAARVNYGLTLFRAPSVAVQSYINMDGDDQEQKREYSTRGRKDHAFFPEISNFNEDVKVNFRLRQLLGTDWEKLWKPQWESHPEYCYEPEEDSRSYTQMLFVYDAEGRLDPSAVKGRRELWQKQRFIQVLQADALSAERHVRLDAQ